MADPKPQNEETQKEGEGFQETFMSHLFELRDRVGHLVEDGRAVLRPVEKLDLKKLARTFTLRSSEGFVENFGPELIARVGSEAPGVRLACASSRASK